jgi:hypothetical protein
MNSWVSKALVIQTQECEADRAEDQDSAELYQPTDTGHSSSSEHSTETGDRPSSEVMNQPRLATPFPRKRPLFSNNNDLVSERELDTSGEETARQIFETKDKSAKRRR